MDYRRSLVDNGRIRTLLPMWDGIIDDPSFIGRMSLNKRLTGSGYNCKVLFNNFYTKNSYLTICCIVRDCQHLYQVLNRLNKGSLKHSVVILMNGKNLDENEILATIKSSEFRQSTTGNFTCIIVDKYLPTSDARLQTLAYVDTESTWFVDDDDEFFVENIPDEKPWNLITRFSVETCLLGGDEFVKTNDAAALWGSIFDTNILLCAVMEAGSGLIFNEDILTNEIAEKILQYGDNRIESKVIYRYNANEAAFWKSGNSISSMAAFLKNRGKIVYKDLINYPKTLSSCCFFLAHMVGPLSDSKHSYIVNCIRLFKEAGIDNPILFDEVVRFYGNL